MPIKRKVVTGVVAAVLLVMVAGAFMLADLAAFPGEIKTPDYAGQVVTDGVKSTFHDGVICRYPGRIPLLEVSGDHYEIGLQYGVLLRPEFMKVIPKHRAILHWASDSVGVPVPLLTAVMKLRAREFYKRIPQRYQDELRGVADGSGLPLDVITGITLFWDISQSGCTAVLMRGPDGTIIHGKNDDSGNLGAVAGCSVLVRARPKGYNTVTQLVSSPTGMMSMMGCNDKGITFSIQTLHAKKNNPQGYPVDVLVRMVLEECSSLDQVYKMLDRYPNSIGGFGVAWSDQKTGQGVVTELTPVGWGKVEMDGPIMWDENRYYNSEMARQQAASTGLMNGNTSREEVAATFPIKTAYTVEDAINFLRLQIGPDGTDYSWCGTRRPICGYQGTQTIIFDPGGNGYYVAFGPSYSARRDVFHVYNDFSREPELIAKAVPIKPVVEEAGVVYMGMENREKKLAGLVGLANKYPEDANIQFLAGYQAYLLSKMDIFTRYCEQAYAMSPQVPEYRFFAGVSAYEKKDYTAAIRLLEGITGQDLKFPAEEVYRVTMLADIYAASDPARSAAYAGQKSALLDKHNAGSLAGADFRSLLQGW